MENGCEPNWPLFVANMLRDPLEDLPETELSSCHGLDHELIGRKRICLSLATGTGFLT
jgi:hypothetical protein